MFLYLPNKEQKHPNFRPMIDLKKIKEDTEVDSIVIADKSGNVIDALGTKHDTNIALMTETAFSMCDDMVKDLLKGDLDQLMAKSPKGFLIANRIKSDSIILVVSKNMSKLGLLLKYMSSLEK
ncbi:roadblock/LC7 domain-containing protein [Aquimarina sp. AU58]|uniref:roadblock/LC7 domain-containing protein n=1 Tax=Aquimarina sp. AU58 TaxID=1874112 RepID=UPI000D64C1F6|nr:roadblock/LC7 domain-containing protein [Aquimarina sp. AU58]